MLRRVACDSVYEHFSPNYKLFIVIYASKCLLDLYPTMQYKTFSQNSSEY